MARLFDGTDDKALITTASQLGSSTNVFPGTTGSTKRHSHPMPFILANGNLLLGYCSNENGTNFEFVQRTSTDGGLTFGSAVTIGGLHSSGVDTFHGSFAQLSDGTLFCAYSYGTEVRYRTSTDNGATWSGETTLDTVLGADGHPSCLLDGSTLHVVYNNSTTVKITSATVTGGSIGSFGSATSIVTGTQGSVVKCPTDGELMVAYTTGGSVGIIKSNDSGVGASWASGAALVTGLEGNLLTDGTVIWLVFDTGTVHSGTYPTVTPGTRIANIRTTTDDGVTWSQNSLLFNTTSYDSHRIEGCLYSGSPIWFSSAINGDTDYHINRLVPTAAAVANGRGGLRFRSIDNLQKWTFWTWLRVDGTVNASDNAFVASKDTNDRVFLQMKSGTTSAGRAFHVFIDRATTDTDYRIVGQVADNTWTFVASTFDDSRGNGARAAFYIGTTPANLTLHAANVVAEGSGAINDDTGGSLYISGRNSDNIRFWKGDLGKCGLANGVLTLAQLQDIMRDILPASPTLIAAYTLDGTVVDLSNNDNDGTYTGTTASSSEPPTFSASTLSRMMLMGCG